jgi:phosphatidate cytidylyltransferase
MDMHRKRWITGLVALPFLIYLIYKGGIAFASLIAVAVILALWEYFHIAYSSRDNTVKKPVSVIAIGYLTGVSMVGVAFHYSAENSAEMLIAVIGANIIISGLIFLFFFKSDFQIIENIRTQIHGIIYIPLSLSILVLIRNGVDGIAWISFLLTIIFAGDISAFYCGTYFGRHKLSPSLSPGKTIEGSIGGFLANILVGCAFKFVLFPYLSWGICIFFFILIGAAGQVGDLFESALKRTAGVKDSGIILPGHGGILDRIDALLFATPIMYFFIIYAQFGR